MTYSYPLDTSYRYPIDPPPVIEDSCCCQSWKCITVLALVALGFLAVGIMALLSSQYPALSDLKVLGVPGGAPFTSVGGLLFVIALLSACCKCCEEDPIPVRADYSGIFTPPHISVPSPVDYNVPPPAPSRLSSTAPYFSSPPLELSAAPIPQLKEEKKEGASENALMTIKHVYNEVFSSAIARALDQKTSTEYPLYLMTSLLLPHEVFMGKYWPALKLVPGTPKPDFDKLAKLFVMGDEELLNLPCEQIAHYDSYELVLIHVRLDQMHGIQAGPEKSFYDLQDSLGHLRSLNRACLSTMDLQLIPPPLLSLLWYPQIEVILQRNDISSTLVDQLLPPKETLHVGQDAILFRSIHHLHQLPVAIITRQLPHLFNRLRDLSEKQFQAPDFPWAQLVLKPVVMQRLFNLGIGEAEKTTKILRCLDCTVIGQLIPVLKSQHLRLLSNKQFESPHFPAKEVAKDPAKAKAMLTVEDGYSAEQETKRILCLMDPQVIKMLSPVLSGKHLRMLSNKQFESPDFPAEEVAKDPAKAKAWLTIEDGYSAEQETKRILCLMDPKVIKILAPVLSGTHLRMLSNKQLESPDFPAEAVAQDPTKAAVWLTLTDGYSDEQETKRILGLMDPKVIKMLGPVLTGKHLRMLSNKQFESPDFPAEEVAKNPKKAADLFALPYYSETEETKRILRLMDSGVIKILGSVLSATHLRMLSEKQWKSPHFPVEALISDPEKAKAFITVESFSDCLTSKRILDCLDPTVRTKLIPALPVEVQKNLLPAPQN